MNVLLQYKHVQMKWKYGSTFVPVWCTVKVIIFDTIYHIFSLNFVKILPLHPKKKMYWEWERNSNCFIHKILDLTLNKTFKKKTTHHIHSKLEIKHLQAEREFFSLQEHLKKKKHKLLILSMWLCYHILRCIKVLWISDKHMNW